MHVIVNSDSGGQTTKKINIKLEKLNFFLKHQQAKWHPTLVISFKIHIGILQTWLE